MKKGIYEATGKEELLKELNNIAEKGIVADQKNLTEDMCSQFMNYREWIREYVVNAFDANAHFCYIYGREDEETITIIVEDNGSGMDRKRILDFNTIFRSVKRGDFRATIGKHGIGKLSVATIPGQCGFEMITSTGKECWHMKTGCLLDGVPIKLECIKPVPPKGTRFEITFKKSVPLEDELSKLHSILNRYVRFLPIEIVLFRPVNDYPESRSQPIWIHDEWGAQAAMFGKSYAFNIGRGKYEAIFSLGPANHELYQSRVLITNRYNLLAYDVSCDMHMPHLNIRIDSKDFKLPFGRHCLSNENVLDKLAKHLRNVILPQYMTELCRFFDTSMSSQHSVPSSEVEELLCAMMECDSRQGSPWCQVPVFAVRNGPRLSLDELRKIVAKTKTLYVEGDDNIGTDYTAFESPVLSLRQPGHGLKLLMKIFSEEIINLSIKDVVMVAPKGYGGGIGQREKKFERCLGFHPEALKASSRQHVKNDNKTYNDGSFFSVEENQDVSGICEELRHALKDLKSIKWRVAYLVERDGKTACKSQKYLLKGDTVILNLNHSEVKKLLELSESDPTLSGHWAVATCLTDDNTILPHLTPEAREDLNLVDAMAKCGTKEALDDERKDEVEDNGDDKFMREFLRNLEDDCSRWLK